MSEFPNNVLEQQEWLQKSPEQSDQEIIDQFQKSQETVEKSRRYEQIEMSLEEQLWADLSVDKPQVTFWPMHETIWVYNEKTGEHIADITKQIDMFTKKGIDLGNLEKNYIYVDWAPSNLEWLKSKLVSSEQTISLDTDNSTQETTEIEKDSHLERLISWNYTAEEFFETNRALYDYMWENMDAIDSNWEYLISDTTYDTFKQKVREYVESTYWWELKSDIKVSFTDGRFLIEDKYFNKLPEGAWIFWQDLPFWEAKSQTQEQTTEKTTKPEQETAENYAQRVHEYKTQAQADYNDTPGNRFQSRREWGNNRFNKQPEQNEHMSQKQIAIQNIVNMSEWVWHNPEQKYDPESEFIIKDIIDNGITYQELVDAGMDEKKLQLTIKNHLGYNTLAKNFLPKWWIKDLTLDWNYYTKASWVNISWNWRANINIWNRTYTNY